MLFDFTYEHVNYFTSKSLRSLFSKTKLHGNIFKNQYQFCIANLNKLKHEDIKLYEDKKIGMSLIYQIILNLLKKK